MRKPIIALTILGVLFATNIYCKYHNLSIPKHIPIEQTQMQLRDYQKDIERTVELKKMQDPTLIQNELRKVGEITSLKGKYNYFSKIIKINSLISSL